MVLSSLSAQSRQTKDITMPGRERRSQAEYGLKQP